eukprot:1354109-Amorphochlora_amoeboformis.AAC.1
MQLNKWISSLGIVICTLLIAGDPREFRDDVTLCHAPERNRRFDRRIPTIIWRIFLIIVRIQMDFNNWIIVYYTTALTI